MISSESNVLECSSINICGRELLKFCYRTEKSCWKNHSPEHTLMLNTGNTLLTIFENGKPIYVNSGDLVLTPATSAVHQEMVSESSSNIFQVSIPEELLHAYSEFTASTESRKLAVSHSIVFRNPLLKEYLLSFIPYFQNTNLVCEKLIKNKLFELLFLLEQTSDVKIFSPNLVDHRGQSSSLSQVLNENVYRSDISVSKIADLTGTSVSTLKRRFRETFPEPMSKWIRLKRMERASYLLISTNKSVKEIAHECGFSSASYFIKQFKRMNGLSPKAYRLKK
jgi:AraC family transcriptional regulator, exoenzyme S synthesis regulatory protein ExsA